MVLTVTTTVDLVGKTQTLTIFNPTQIDQIVFSSNQITWQSQSGYNLLKSDLLLFCQFIAVFNTLLLVNFPSIASFANGKWPLSQFECTETFAGVLHINFLESTIGNTVLGINYVPIAGSAGITARGSAITISLQEWFSSVVFLAQYRNQVNLN